MPNAESTARRIGGALIAVAVAGGLAACSGSPAQPTATGTTSPQASSVAAPVQLAFGTPHTFPSGATLTVSEPQPYTEFFEKSALSVDLTTVNNTQQSLSLSAVQGYATLDGQQMLIGINDAFTHDGGTLLPGQTSHTKQLYTTTDATPPPGPGDLVIEYDDQTTSDAADAVYYRGHVDVVSLAYVPTAPTIAPATSTVVPPTTRVATPTTTSGSAPTTSRLAPPTKAPTPKVDSGPGCAQRAMSRGAFNPACPEYQGYLDPGGPGRGPTSGELQHQHGCEQGYIPADQCH